MALQFEPIHRIVTGVDPCALLQDWCDYCQVRGMVMGGVPTPDEQVIRVCFGGYGTTVPIGNPEGPIPCATLQIYLDDFLARHPEAEIDYIHGDEVLRGLAEAPGAIGFLLPPLAKADFFRAVSTLGILPRKTFSMGHAHEKRFYMECRQIR